MKSLELKLLQAAKLASNKNKEANYKLEMLKVPLQTRLFQITFCYVLEQVLLHLQEKVLQISQEAAKYFD
ncbi:MAG: hypothetical protein U5L01_05500 [Rheinheimera sp.]|nr:hypothetical protein [Rheinheimera sp.]